ncbi:MAG: SH3 domain-containing protein [Bacteroidales bacterium]|nr:SH3 domain-containing protein [Bacteroidales bacterium]MDY4557300.1 SH3 domain-containing protein [Alloprevotella sp.]
MALPEGFNPNNMSFGNLTSARPVINIPRNTQSFTQRTSGTFRRRSLWSRFNDTVADIGNWFAEKTEDVLGWFSLAAMVVIGIGCLIFVVSTFIQHGIVAGIFALIGAIIVGVIMWYIAAFAIVVGVNVIMYGFRLLFWNGWTLLLAIGVVAGVCVSSQHPEWFDRYADEPTEVVADTTPTYECTAAYLNVRSKPKKTSRVIGTLKQGDRVKSEESENGFLRIEYNGRTGYASLKYLELVNENTEE